MIRRSLFFPAGVLMLALTSPKTLAAFQINDALTLSATLALGAQCQKVSSLEDTDNICRGGMTFIPQLSFTPTEQDQIFLQFDFPLGKALNTTTPFVLAPWAANLENDVLDINGTGRNYLQVAWYAHRFQLGEEQRLQVTGGILDAGAYQDDNAYANDELLQFMNAAFVNSYSAYLPNFSGGGALVWELQDWTLSALALDAGKNDLGNHFNYFSAGAAYHLQTALGEGHYRLMLYTTSHGFPDGAELEQQEGGVLSFDQELNPVLGAFLRLGWARDRPGVEYVGRYTGGINLKGRLWGREDDNIGLALGYLEGPGWNQDLASGEQRGGQARIAVMGLSEPSSLELNLESTKVLEAYYRIVINDELALSADVQYMRDAYRQGQAVAGWIFGIRGVASF